MAAVMLAPSATTVLANAAAWSGWWGGAVLVPCLVTLVLGVPLVIVLHESGHALVARAVGGRVYLVQIGLGDPRRKWRIGSTHLWLALRPGGRVWWAPRALDGWRWRRAVVSMGGLAVNLVVAVCAFCVAASLERSGSRLWIPAGFFGVLNLLELINLVPSSSRPTDGGNLLAAVRSTRDHAHDAAFAQMLDEVKHRIREADGLWRERARSILAVRPDRPEAQLVMALALAAEDRLAEARSHLVAAQASLSDAGVGEERERQLVAAMQQLAMEIDAATERGTGASDAG